MGSTWYTLDLHIEAFIPSGHQGLYPSIEELHIKCVSQVTVCVMLLSHRFEVLRMVVHELPSHRAMAKSLVWLAIRVIVQ